MDWLQKFIDKLIFVFVEKQRYLYIVKGLQTTIIVTLFALLLGLLIGIIVAVIRTAHDQMAESRRDGITGALLNILNAVCRLYLTVIRGTPTMVQLLLMFFVFLASSNNKVMVAILTFGINSGAYVAEIFRSGIMSIDKGQMEAGRSLGMTWVQTMRYIIIPQAFKRVIPQLGNEFIALLKDSSLVSVIGFEELTRRGQLIIAKTYASVEIWTCVAIIYLAMTLSISRLVAYLEWRFKTDDKH